MSSFFLNPWMLLGLSAVVIPPLIHLLNRRRYDVVDWGAMRFLQVSEVTRRRLFLEELLLMLLRMVLIAVLVVSLAGPFLTSAFLARLGARSNRDVVLVFDGSYSMGSIGKEGVPHEKAKEWAKAFVADLTPGDSVAVLQAKDQVVPVLAAPSHDFERVQKSIDKLPPPSGGCDWRPALRAAAEILTHSQRPEREIILLSDGQRFGWADRDSLFRWSLLAGELGLEQSESSSEAIRPRFRVVNVALGRDAHPPNWSLTPLRCDRPLVPVGREVIFRTAMDLHGQKVHAHPYRVRLEIDGKWVRDLIVPGAAELTSGKVPLSFGHRFAAPGSHRVALILEADPPPEKRPAKYAIKDEVPGDNRQDYAIEVVRALPVLIVDGDTLPPKDGRDFLRDALAPALDPTPVVRVRVVSIDEFEPSLLATPPGEKGEESARPRVLILRNVARLSDAQREAVGQFLADGGGVLVTLGHRVERSYYNEELYRGGGGWLPAKLDDLQGDLGKPEDGAHPVPGGSDHPALRLFLEKTANGNPTDRFPQLGEARFPRWWKLSAPSRNSAGAQVASLRARALESPFLVEWIDPRQSGRLLLCAVPLDDSWGANIINQPAFVPLVHELVYYLAAARAAEFNLEPGQPLRYRLESIGAIEQYTLQTPLGETKPLSTNPADKDSFLAAVDRLPHGSVLRIDGLRETGVYRLTTAEGGIVWYVMRPKQAEESNLTPCSEQERAILAELVPGMRYQNEPETPVEEWVQEEHRQELWWWLLLGLIALLCGEVWMTRRIVKNR